MHQPVSFLEQTGEKNPFAGITVKSQSSPTLADIDRDGDDDLILGDGGGRLIYYENTGSMATPEFVDRTESSPFSTINTGERAVSGPLYSAFADVDGDGDVDAVIGSEEKLSYYENIGSSESLNYVERVGENNPFEQTSKRSDFAAPTFADINADRKLDLVVGLADGSFDYYQNTNRKHREGEASYVLQVGNNSPFTSIGTDGKADGNSRLAFADFGGGRALDLVVGSRDGRLNYYENVAALASSPRYVRRTGDTNLFDAFDVGDRSAPALSDIDNDGDYDALVGAEDGTLTFYENRRVISPDESALLLNLDDDLLRIFIIGEGNTLQISTEQLNIGSDGEVLVFISDNGDGTDATQIASFLLPAKGIVPTSDAPVFTIDRSLIAERKYLRVELVENGTVRTAKFRQLSNRVSLIEFDADNVLKIQAFVPTETSSLMIGDADAIDLSSRSGTYNFEFNVYREAAYDNTVGFYRTDTADGAIVTDPISGATLRPGNTGYRQAALDRQIETRLTGENGRIQTFAAQIAGGGFISSFLIADGTNPDRQVVYFSQSSANRNQNDHVKLLGDNAFGFEDLAGLGDRDYNDIVVAFTAT